MADRATLVTDLRLVVKTRGLGRQFFLNAGVALEAKLTNARTLEHLWIARAVRRVARRAALGFDWAVFENERPLFVRVALDTRSVGTIGKLGLFGLKATVGVVAVAAFHHALGHFVVKRFVEFGLL